MKKKITVGFVIQNYNEAGICISQEFIAGDQVDYEDANGNPTDAPENEVYQPFDMVQPKEEDGFVEVPYHSSFDEGSVTAETTAKYNPATGQIKDVICANVEGTDYCDRDWIEYNGKEIDVCRECFEYVLEKNESELKEDEEPQCHGNCC